VSGDFAEMNRASLATAANELDPLTLELRRLGGDAPHRRGRRLRVRKERNQSLPRLLVDALFEFAVSDEAKRLYATRSKKRRPGVGDAPLDPLLYVAKNTARMVDRIARRAGALGRQNRLPRHADGVHQSAARYGDGRQNGPVDGAPCVACDDDERLRQDESGIGGGCRQRTRGEYMFALDRARHGPPPDGVGGRKKANRGPTDKTENRNSLHDRR